MSWPWNFMDVPCTCGSNGFDPDCRFLGHSDPPAECSAMLWHGPGHQSRARCQIRGPHEIHEAVYGSHEQLARWRGEKAFSGFVNEPPAEPES